MNSVAAQDSLQAKDVEVDNYMGMVCDFSDAEKNGFERGLQQRFNVSKGDYPLEKFYAFCEVHFDRSECRV